ncbi:MAG: putative phosphothreonine lyase domain-containing protein [Candidatus Njordarchaeales archaeon]
MNIDNFLELKDLTEIKRFLPTRVVSPDIDWIYVNNPKLRHIKRPYEYAFLDKIVERDSENKQIFYVIYLEKTKDSINIKEKIPFQLTPENIIEAAKLTNIKTGKWLIFVNENMVDELWEIVAKKTLLGEFNHIFRAKVSTPPQKKYLIAVYTKDFLDMDDLMGAREELKEIGVKWKIKYKPDIYTLLDIYSGDIIRPYIHHI